MIVYISNLIILLWYKVNLHESWNGDVRTTVLGINSSSEHLVCVVLSCKSNSRDPIQIIRQGFQSKIRNILLKDKCCHFLAFTLSIN